MSDTRRYSLFPKALSGCVEPLIRPVLKQQGLAGSRIISEWPAIVGEALARHSVPEKLSFQNGKKTGGNLTIAVESGFAPQMQHMVPMILERLAVYFGYQAISRISISHGYAKAVAKVAPTPEPTPKAIDMSVVDNVEDDELRKALRSIGDYLAGNK